MTGMRASAVGLVFCASVLAGAPALVPDPAATAPTDPDAIREAFFAVGVRHAKAKAQGPNRAGCLCLAQEKAADPPPEMIKRLAAEHGLVLYGMRECLRRRLSHQDPEEMGGFSNVLAIEKMERRGQTAVAMVRFFGHSRTVSLRWRFGRWETEDQLDLPPPFPPPVRTPDPQVTDAMRQAVFAEGLRIGKDFESRGEENPPGCYCLAQEHRGDPSPAVVARLAKDSGLRVYSSSECERRGLSYKKPASLGGFANLIFIVEIRVESPSRALAEVRMLGGSGLVVLTLKDGEWKGECCEGGLVG